MRNSKIIMPLAAKAERSATNTILHVLFNNITMRLKLVVGKAIFGIYVKFCVQWWVIELLESNRTDSMASERYKVDNYSPQNRSKLSISCFPFITMFAVILANGIVIFEFLMHELVYIN